MGVDGAKRILAVVASPRPGGNSESLARVALRAVAARGAWTALVFLRELDIRFCDGCLACVFRGGECRQADDIPWLYRTVGDFDGLLLVAPTYLLGVPAQVKAVMDRSAAYFGRTSDRGPVPAGVIAVAGLPGWDYLTLPTLSQLAYLLGGRVVGGVIGYAPGPGETLLDRSLLDRVTELALAVLEERELPPPPGVCPVCYLPRPAGESEPCPLCLYDPARPGQHRFTREGLARFALEWMLPSRERFLARRDEVRRAREALLVHEPAVLRPSGPSDPAPQ